jgi:SSS family solute:Na+ symporter
LSDWFPSGNVSFGRWVMVVMAIIGNLPVFTDATILQATTISGTMVMGLAPIFLFFWWDRAGRASFHLAFWSGLLLGLWSTLAGKSVTMFGLLSVVDTAIPIPSFPEWVRIGQGDYAQLLGINLYGLILCVGLYVLGAFVFGRSTRAEQARS